MLNQPQVHRVGKTHCKCATVTTQWDTEVGLYYSQVEYKDGNKAREIYEEPGGLLKAQSGHTWWVRHLNTDKCLHAIIKKETKPIKISLTALVRLLYGWIGESYLQTQLNQVDSNLMYLKIAGIPMAGECTYDLAKGEVVYITDFWRGLFDGHKMRKQTESDLAKLPIVIQL